MTKLLEGRTAIIYGAGGGLGGGVARTFAREGGHVFLAGRSRENLDAVAADITSAGGSADVAVLDALDERAVDEAALGPNWTADEFRFVGKKLVDRLRVNRLILHARQHERGDHGRGHRQTNGNGGSDPALALRLFVVPVSATWRRNVSAEGRREIVLVDHGSTRE